MEEKKERNDEMKNKKDVISLMKRISVEPSIALFGLGFSLIGVQVPTLYIQKTCKVGSFFFSNQTFSIEVSCISEMIRISYL